jgi:hypothetical protein
MPINGIANADAIIAQVDAPQRTDIVKRVDKEMEQ